MKTISIKFRDGTSREFAHRGRAGGSYTIRVRYEGAWVVVEDEWGQTTAFPSETVAEVIATPETSW